MRVCALSAVTAICILLIFIVWGKRRGVNLSSDVVNGGCTPSLPCLSGCVCVFVWPTVCCIFYGERRRLIDFIPRLWPTPLFLLPGQIWGQIRIQHPILSLQNRRRVSRPPLHLLPHQAPSMDKLANCFAHKNDQICWFKQTKCCPVNNVTE